ncbi:MULTISPECIES: hypothetical protein [Enterobacteriaceae]|uniref:hypothetical protein n=1 Tax=Enterobacteriaceae TaxID=543 RepID=UPI0012CF6AA4|nr:MULTISPECIES: hypothetical protein [Enterobacteriaceae]ECV0411905.1 hypothetical protein [Salmonella enterica subsp. enterica serovar Montevideo]QKN43407.1 hypothetical protein HHJ34_24420 [Escherichia coli]UTK77708.1 hypothetical protein NL713_23910 [Salmonella enterica subsp. enterica serovar Mbandaka]HDN1277539.1 hypothetical protein [Escherichia coli]
MSYRAIISTFDPENASTVNTELFQTFATAPEAEAHGRKSLAEIQQEFFQMGYAFIVSYFIVEVPAAEIIQFITRS